MAEWRKGRHTAFLDNCSIFVCMVVYTVPSVPQGNGQHDAHKSKDYSQDGKSQDGTTGSPWDNQNDSLWWLWHTLCRRSKHEKARMYRCSHMHMRGW